ncbi:MAG: flavodoxin [Bacteroidales bacterium]|nr:flavodoxin [Bacteroidales bacterium]
MDNTLIVFASNHGAVEKCARELFRVMDGKVDICNLNRREFTPDLSKYDSIIIGGSIHYGKIQKVIADFSIKNRDLLVSKHLGLFISCLFSGEKAQQQLDNAYPDELNRHAAVRDYFGGEVNIKKLRFWERIITNQMIENEDLVVKLSKEKIHRFAETLKASYADKK